MMMGFEYPSTSAADRRIFQVRNLILVTFGLFVIVESGGTITRNVTNLTVPIFTRRLSRLSSDPLSL